MLVQCMNNLGQVCKKCSLQATPADVNAYVNQIDSPLPVLTPATQNQTNSKNPLFL